MLWITVVQQEGAKTLPSVQLERPDAVKSEIVLGYEQRMHSPDFNGEIYLQNVMIPQQQPATVGCPYDINDDTPLFLQAASRCGRGAQGFVASISTSWLARRTVRS